MKNFYAYFSLCLSILFTSPIKCQLHVYPLDSIPISFSVASPEMAAYANQVLRNTDQVMIPVPYHYLASQISLPKKSILNPSLDSAILWPDSIFNHINIFGYDFEHWPYTPDSEKANPEVSSQRARDFAHAHGLLYNLGPDLAFASTVGPEMATYADGFALQLQKYQHNSQVFTDTLKAISKRLRVTNPNIKIIAQIGAQVSGVNRSVQEMLVAADSARRYADGIGIFYGKEVDTLKKFISIIRPNKNYTSTGEVKIDRQFNQFNIHPNPFNTFTTIEFYCSSPSIVTLNITDINGKEVAKLISGTLPEGNLSFQWFPQRIITGTYFCTLQIGSYKEVKKIVIKR